MFCKEGQLPYGKESIEATWCLTTGVLVVTAPSFTSLVLPCSFLFFFSSLALYVNILHFSLILFVLKYRSNLRSPLDFSLPLALYVSPPYLLLPLPKLPPRELPPQGRCEALAPLRDGGTYLPPVDGSVASSVYFVLC